MEANENLKDNPHTDIMGVEIGKASWHVDYLTVTVWGMEVQQFFSGWFPELGELYNQNHGGRFYQETYRNELGVIVRKRPYDGSDRQTIEIPGKACQLMGYERMCSWFQGVNRMADRVQIARIDIAMDDVPFTPKQLYQEMQGENFRSLAKRNTIKFYESPLEKRENGIIGTSGVTLGSRSSMRYMRCYDLHGYNRLEVEYKEEKAQLVGYDILYAGDDETALRIAFGHLLDYLDFTLVTWWDSFKQSFKRLYAKLTKTAKEFITEKKINWLKKQVSGTLYACRVLCGYDLLKELEEEGNKIVMTKVRFKSLMSLAY